MIKITDIPDDVYEFIVIRREKKKAKFKNYSTVDSMVDLMRYGKLYLEK